MDPSDQVTQQYLISAAIIALGVSGWMLPLKWNLLKLRAPLGRSVSEQTNVKIARAVGAMLVVGGILVAIGTYQVGALK